MPNLDDILKMAQDLQSKMEDAQRSLDSIGVEGASGGGLVKVRAMASGRMTGLDIDPSLIVPDDKAMLEDLIVAAFNDAGKKAQAAGDAEKAKLTAGLPIPPGFKLPM
jgi:DNA-binding YbaB/EbfC family protein